MKNIKDKARQYILSKYMTFEGKIATVHLYYDTFSELIDQNLGNDKVEKLNDTLLNKIDEIMEILPLGYKLHVMVHIKDLGDYTLEETKRIINQNVELTVYIFAVEQKKKRIKVLSLFITGCILLLISYLLGDLEWPQILFDIINISGTVLLWEAANIVFIESNDDSKRAIRYLKQFKEIVIINESNAN